MKGTKKTQRIMLAIAFPIILAGLVLVVCEMYELMESVKLFGTLNLGISLIVIGAVLTFLAPKPPRKKGPRSIY
ncbi:MAG: hypothetical protein V7745_08085 [Pseudomonadales bacterium]